MLGSFKNHFFKKKYTLRPVYINKIVTRPQNTFPLQFFKNDLLQKRQKVQEVVVGMSAWTSKHEK